MASLVQRPGVSQEAVHPRELVSELRAGLRISVRGIQAADEHAVRGCLQVPALGVAWISGSWRRVSTGVIPLARMATPFHEG